MKKLVITLSISSLLMGCAQLSNTSALDSVVKIAQSIEQVVPASDTTAKSYHSTHKSYSHSTKHRNKHRHHAKSGKSARSQKNQEDARWNNTSQALKQMATIGLGGLGSGSDIVGAVGVGVAAVATLAIIGGELAHYFTEQDKENAVKVLKKTNRAKSVAWCSDSKEMSEDVASVHCAKNNKIIQTPGEVTKKEVQSSKATQQTDSQPAQTKTQQLCRSLKTEVVTPDGEIKTESQQLCQAENGEWYDAKAA